MSQLFTAGGQSIGSSASVLPRIFRVDFLYDWLVWSPCSPRDSKSLLQHHNLKTSVLQCSAFFMVQLSHPYMATGKIIALTLQTFVGKVMSLRFNMLSRLVITFLPRDVSFNFMAAVTICSDFGAPKIKSLTVSIVFPSICHEVMVLDDYFII